MHANYLSPQFASFATSRSGLLRARRKSSKSIAPNGCSRRSSRRRRTPTSISAIALPISGPSRLPRTKLTGEQAEHDLRLFVEDLSDAANVPADAAGEQVLTVERSEQDVQRFDQDGLALAAAGAGQPAIRVRRAQARWVSCAARSIGSSRRTRSAFAAERDSASSATKSATRSSTWLADWRMPAVARRKSRAALPSGWTAAWKRFVTRSSNSTTSTRTWPCFRPAPDL